MKILAYTLYVVTVLLISGLARANAAPMNSTEGQYQIPVQVAQVSIDQSNQALLVAGSLPNPCYANPSVLMTQDSQNPTLLTVHLTSSVPDSICIEKIKFFNSDLNLATMAKASHVQIDRESIYTVKVEGSDFELRVPGSDFTK